MKKVISVLLILIMVLSLCACSGEKKPAAAQPKEFRVGYSRVNITPNYSVPLAGYGNTARRMNQGFISYIYTTCIAITDTDDSTVLLFTSDMLGVNKELTAAFRKSISEATGVSEERIMLTCTHSHSGPDIWSSEPIMSRYREDYTQYLITAAKEALDDRSAATIETGVSHTEQLSFVRHYTTTSGELYGANLTLNGSITGHTSEPDNEIQIIRFVRAAKDKKDILAINWQAHAKLDSDGETEEGKMNRPMLSADYIGAARDYVEANSDVLFAFYLGAAGNLSANSKDAKENASTKCAEYGALLGGHILDGMKNMTAVDSANAKVVVSQQTYNAKIDHTEDTKVIDAQKIYDVWSSTNNYNEAMALATGTDIHSPYHASSILSRSRISEETLPLELNAIRVGPIGFVTAPYEMFDVSGMAIKDGSPFETTFVMTCANGYYNYIAAEYAFAGRGTYEVHNRTFVQGTAEDLVSTFVDMLTALN